MSVTTQLRSADHIARRSNIFGAKYVAMITVDMWDQLQTVVDKCLMERGYGRMKLTREQAHSLRQLKRHIPE
jgi:hypothetical protein